MERHEGEFEKSLKEILVSGPFKLFSLVSWSNFLFINSDTPNYLKQIWKETAEVVQYFQWWYFFLSLCVFLYKRDAHVIKYYSQTFFFLIVKIGKNELSFLNVFYVALSLYLF